MGARAGQWFAPTIAILRRTGLKSTRPACRSTISHRAFNGDCCNFDQSTTTPQSIDFVRVIRSFPCPDAPPRPHPRFPFCFCFCNYFLARNGGIVSKRFQLNRGPPIETPENFNRFLGDCLVCHVIPLLEKLAPAYIDMMDATGVALLRARMIP